MADKWPTTTEGLLNLSPEEFENFIADLWAAKGYDEIDVQQYSRDKGIDVIVEKDGERIAIQAKRYSKGNNVEPREMREYKSLLQNETVDAVEIVTTSDFTRDALKVAQGNHLLRIKDGDELVQQAQYHKPERGEAERADKPGRANEGPEAGSFSGLLDPSNTYLRRGMLPHLIFIIGITLVVAGGTQFETLTAVLVMLGMISLPYSAYAFYKDLVGRTRPKSGIAALWLVLFGSVPIIGALVYMAARP